MWKNDAEGQCCQRKTPESDKTKFYFILLLLFSFFFENQEKLWKFLVFRVFIALAYLFFRVAFNYIYIIVTFELYQHSNYIYIRNGASLSLFYRYYFGRCSSELPQLVPLPFSRGRSSRYSDRLHDFSVTIPRCCKDVYVNSFFPRTARLWNSLPIDCFPLTYDQTSDIF